MRPQIAPMTRCGRSAWTPGFACHAEGSCLIKFGDTYVLVTASLEKRRRPFARAPARAGSRLNTACCPAHP